MKLYVAGPMTGLPGENRKAFHAMAKRLRSLGHDVINPAELDSFGSAPPPQDCYRRDLLVLLKDREGVVVLPGWRKSRGAKAEVFNIDLIGKRVYRLVNSQLKGIPSSQLPKLSFISS
jgi:hypothetical protein